ncbi:MAG: U32 family peptidase [Clostridia bacterium]|nr:U32 family peptidase [Clostridia bacterium]
MNDQNQTRPELLVPAGDSRRLRTAIRFKADAVYLGGTAFGMRSAPDNFDDAQLEVAVALAHANGVKVYLTVNVLPRSGELPALPRFLAHAASCNVDALIVSDLGVLEYAKQYAPGVPLHISTQMGVVNYAAANALYRLGARRIVTARELSLKELKVMRANIPQDLELECFIHGAMCVSFSGRCLLSNYLAGRDSNRGDCAQPCRWTYNLVEEKRPGQFFPIEDRDGATYILNAKDLCMIEHLPELIDAGINSFKIEGRAKSEYYVAVVTNAYRKALDGYFAAPSPGYRPEQWVADELTKISYRDYCTGFFFGDPRETANISFRGGYNRLWDVMAIVERSEHGRVFCTQRNRFFAGDTLEVLTPDAVPFTVTADDLQNADGEPIEATSHPMMPFSFACDVPLAPETILRKARDD